MNPLKLRFSGIGSYPGEVEINFRDLNQKGLYLIVGPTGSGKTTLLDAMSYALYGAMPSERTNAIVSLHPNRLKPEIEFEFEHGARKFVVHREPAIPGKQIVTNKQWIREHDGAGVVINTITGSRDVTDKCEEIIGLTVDEFTQVILLPQGKFQKFLMAKGSEKQAILQTIFGTSTYRRVVESLKASADELEKEIEDDQVEIGNQWSNIDSNILALADLDLGTEIPDPRSDLDATTNLIQTLVEDFSQRESLAKESLLQLQADHTRASADAKRFDDSQKLALLRMEESRVSKSIVTARQKVDAHEDALPVLETASNRDRLAKNLSDQNQEIVEVRAELTRRAHALVVEPRITKTFRDAIASASPVQLTNEFTKLEQRLSEAESAHSELSQVNSDITAHEKELKSNAGEVLRLTKVATTKTSDVKKSSVELKKSRDKVKGLAAAERAVDALDDLLEKANVKETTEALRIANAKAKEARAKFDKAERALREAMSAKTKALAGSLAEDLEGGEPCPVCGSKDHPRKAKGSTRSLNVESTERARDAASKSLLNAERDLKDAQKALENAQGFAKRVPSPNEQKQIRNRYEVLEKLSNELDDLENAHTEIVESLDEAKEMLSEAKSYSAELKSEKSALEKLRAKNEATVHSIGSQKDVASSLRGCRDIEKSLKRLETCVKKLDALKGEAKNATKSFESALEKSPFKVEKEAQKATLTAVALTAHKSEIAQFDKLKTDILKLEASIGSDPLPEARPRVEEIQERLEEAALTTTEISNVAGSLRASSKQINSAKHKIERIGPKIEEKLSNSAKARSISTVFEKGAGGAGGQLGLEVWIQRTLFQEVCLVANTQLRTLSNNQYSLTLEQADGGVAKSHGSGLDIYVLDSYNGTTRPVQSMSGGEQFMASLSLALAMAEVVQQHAGGVELPCLFIDEGFGGLDSESLDLAINVLGEIQASGRTVGIITHVEEMINRLPIGIQVRKSENGSTLEVIGS